MQHRILFCLFAASTAYAEPAWLAKVDGEFITQEGVNETMSTLGQPHALSDATADEGTRIVDSVIDRRLLERAAKAEGADKAPEFQRRLALIKTDLMIQLYIEHAAAKALDEAALRAYFAVNEDRFTFKES